MKKTIILSFVLLASAIMNSSFGNGPGDPAVIPNREIITTLIIDANVTVVLVNNPRATTQVVGEQVMNKFLRIQHSGDTLTIGSSKKRNLKGSGIVYVPASLLTQIRINGESDVRSYYPLQVSKLNVVINAADCSVAVSNIGELNLTSTPMYNFEHTTEIRRIPASLVQSLAF